MKIMHLRHIGPNLKERGCLKITCFRYIAPNLKEMGDQRVNKFFPCSCATMPQYADSYATMRDAWVFMMVLIYSFMSLCMFSLCS